MWHVTVQRHYLDLTGNSKNHCRSTGRKTRQGPLYCKQVCWIKVKKKKKTKKKNTAKTVCDQSCSTSAPKRSSSVKIDQIENVTVKKPQEDKKTSIFLLSCLFKVATPYHVILCNFRSLFYFIYISVNSWYLNKPDEDWYWPVEISQPNSISRCLISPCKSLLDCNVFNVNK